jgi:DNA-binding response OmpR family regulator
VDDYSHVAEVLSDALDEHGFDVTTATDFQEARTKLLTGDFDVLVTDVRLGPFNGLQLAVIARTNWPAMRIVVISGYDDLVLKAEAFGVNAAYLVKPIVPEHLITTLQSIPEAES